MMKIFFINMAILAIMFFILLKQPGRKEFFQKGQFTRLIDVFLLGPFMVKFGSMHNGIAGTIMIISGLLTIFYNGYNFIGLYSKKWKLPPLPL